MNENIYDYLDYRKFLQDHFQLLKKQNPHFSYRYFNRLAGIQSASFLKLVMDGKRNLGRLGIQKVIQGFKLEKEAADYFEKLVHFNQAKNHEEKEKYFEKLYTQKASLRRKKITTAQYHLFSRWYYVAILEALRLTTPKKKTATWLSQILFPKITLREVKMALRELKKLDMISEAKSGHLKRKEAMLATPDEVASLFVVNFHQEMSILAAEAVKKQAAELREFSALTAAVSQKNFEKFKQEIRHFRKKLHALSEQSDDCSTEVVVQVNLQLFRLNQT